VSTPEPDRATAQEMSTEPDFAGEHDKPSYADELQERASMGKDESTPDELAGMDPE
jgi:hypothetical protein